MKIGELLLRKGLDMSKGGFEFAPISLGFVGKLALSSRKHLRTEFLVTVSATKHLRRIRVFSRRAESYQTSLKSK